MIEKIILNDVMLALIVRGSFDQDGIKFFTPDDFSQQLGYMKRPKGYVVRPHVHRPVLREVQYTKEVLFIRKGLIRIDFYDNEKVYIESKILRAGDVILLAYGGHGIEILEEAVIIEVKQGPYAGNDDKVRFDPIDNSEVRFKNPSEANLVKSTKFESAFQSASISI